MRRIPLLAGLILFAFALLPMAAAPAQTAALTGQVSSAEEGAMEGVLVSAKKAGSTITITVVSDKDGRFSFPAGPARARPVCAPHPRHRLRSRQSQEHRGRGAEDHHADLKLRKTEDLAAQMSNAEWINSIPGNDPRKGVFLNCVGCHTLERVMRSTHSSEDFLDIMLPRMQSYVNQSIPQHPQLRKAERLMEERGDLARADLHRRRRTFWRPSISVQSRSGASRSSRCRGRAAAPRA